MCKPFVEDFFSFLFALPFRRSCESAPFRNICISIGELQCVVDAAQVWLSNSREQDVNITWTSKLHAYELHLLFYLYSCILRSNVCACVCALHAFMEANAKKSTASIYYRYDDDEMVSAKLMLTDRRISHTQTHSHTHTQRDWIYRLVLFFAFLPSSSILWLIAFSMDLCGMMRLSTTNWNRVFRRCSLRQ